MWHERLPANKAGASAAVKNLGSRLVRAIDAGDRPEAGPLPGSCSSA
jgi:hypothetical protein